MNHPKKELIFKAFQNNLKSAFSQRTELQSRYESLANCKIESLINLNTSHLTSIFESLFDDLTSDEIDYKNLELVATEVLLKHAQEIKLKLRFHDCESLRKSITNFTVPDFVEEPSFGVKLSFFFEKKEI